MSPSARSPARSGWRRSPGSRGRRRCRARRRSTGAAGRGRCRAARGARCRRAAAPCTACRSPPGRPRPERPRHAGRRDSRPRTAAGARRSRPPAATAAGCPGCWRGRPADRPRLTSADRLPVRAKEEDRGPVALEQDHRVIDQTGQDPVEVEAAADVAGHPAQRLGPMEQVGDLVGAPRAADERADRVRRRPGRRRCRARRAIPASRRRHAGRPRARARRGSPRPARAGRRARPPARPRPAHRAGWRAWRSATGPLPTGGQSRAPCRGPRSGPAHRPGGADRRRRRWRRRAGRGGRRGPARSRRGGGRRHHGPRGRRYRAPRRVLETC